ncbi:uncharacterized protein RCC_03495 [Ramularia collo-cygni]|uniref:Uncharacterized protein n=1 Tax=Ramularia collo-cygni TaxID=112498 RepID=A0A2D3USB9_9PEZI|nr:uncharacterized protein RCC_03495 [Ramularia collo-cygni]CZT17658.1 uncharacterized protein RCC_03495 [Ramularia collo-cygni]
MPDPGEIYDDAMDLGLRLWLMVDCSWIQTTGTPWIWPEGMTIQTYVAAWFDPPPADPQDDKKRFPRKFTADNLERIAGIRVTWTDFLSEHLALNGNNEEISIFKHREWLQTLSDSRTSDSVSAQTVKMNGPATSDSCGLPTELLDETLRSIELLFPLTDEATNEFLKRQGMDISAFQVEPNSGGAPRRAPRLREFRYWREQLLDLIEEYESPPRHSRKIWRDRRNPMAFWTFWIGIVIFFSTLAFGLIAAVLAGVTIGDERNGRLSDARVNSSTIV